MLKRHVGRLRDHFGVSSACVFGKGPACASENFVARSELRYLAANRFHLAGQVHAESWILWFAEPGLHAKGIGHAPHEVPVIGIHRCRAYSDQNFIILGRRLVHVFVLENFRRTVGVIKDCFYEDILRALPSVMRLWQQVVDPLRP